MTTPHPGTVVFIDRDAGTEESRPYDEVPQTVAFAPGENGPIPVVRVEEYTEGNECRVLSFDEAGTLIGTHIMTIKK